MNFSLDSLGKAALQGATRRGSEKSKCSLLSTGINYLQSDFGISEGHCLYRRDNEASSWLNAEGCCMDYKAVLKF